MNKSHSRDYWILSGFLFSLFICYAFVYAMSADFSPNEELTGRRISCADCPLNDREVSWSPDSRTLAVTRTQNRVSENVYLFDIERWQYRRLTDGEPSIEGHTWSRDGSHLLYVSDKHSLDRRIWAVDIATGNKRELGHEGAGFPVYLPDYDAIMSVSLSAAGAPGVDGAYWLRVVVTTLIIAGFCGLLVDVLRFLANRFWTKKPKFRIKLRKILKTHLA